MEKIHTPSRHRNRNYSAKRFSCFGVTPLFLEGTLTWGTVTGFLIKKPEPAEGSGF